MGASRLRLRAACLRAGLALALAARAAAPAGAALKVVVAGHPVSVSRPPVERQGHVFVPLEGTFEHLGASVVYDRGAIGITGNGQWMQLHVGSKEALVDGVTVPMPVAPFVEGKTVMVPATLVSEVLGAEVHLDRSHQVVSIAYPPHPRVAHAAAPRPTPRLQPSPARRIAARHAVPHTPSPRRTPVPSHTPPRVALYRPPAAPAPWSTPTPGNAVSVLDIEPAAGALVTSAQPAISGAFSEPVEPSTVRIAVDGTDLTGAANVTAEAFEVVPALALRGARHRVRVSGTSVHGAPFSRTWTFGLAPSSTPLPFGTIVDVRPLAGSHVPSAFTVSGRAMPGARVGVTATATTNVAGMFSVQTDTFVAQTVADAAGRFEQHLALHAPSGSTVAVRIVVRQQSGAASATAEETYVLL